MLKDINFFKSDYPFHQKNQETRNQEFPNVAEVAWKESAAEKRRKWQKADAEVNSSRHRKFTFFQLYFGS